MRVEVALGNPLGGGADQLDRVDDRLDKVRAGKHHEQNDEKAHDQKPAQDGENLPVGFFQRDDIADAAKGQTGLTADLARDGHHLFPGGKAALPGAVAVLACLRQLNVRHYLVLVGREARGSDENPARSAQHHHLHHLLAGRVFHIRARRAGKLRRRFTVIPGKHVGQFARAPVDGLLNAVVHIALHDQRKAENQSGKNKQDNAKAVQNPAPGNAPYLHFSALLSRRFVSSQNPFEIAAGIFPPPRRRRCAVPINTV